MEELSLINITNNANANMRAFKSLHWALRWNRTNLSIFEKYKPICLPYYNDKICEFICRTPEKHLSNRKIQIEYINESPELAKIICRSMHLSTYIIIIGIKYLNIPTGKNKVKGNSK